MKKGLLFGLLNVVVISCSAQIICIDPGHGYGPLGENLDNRTKEEIITNCEVALRLDSLLSEKNYSVILTRNNSDTGCWMSLTQRSELADNYESERLLSIHCNGGGGTGSETFWCYRNSPNRNIDSIFSGLVQASMVEYGEWYSRRSIEDYEYLGFHLGVLKGATPGCLNEIGFVDTQADCDKLLDNSWRDRFAFAYLVAIDSSFKIEYPEPSPMNSTANNFSDVFVFPNPFSSVVHIVGQALYGITECTITASDGRIIRSIQYHSVNSEEIIIYTSDLPVGLYILTIANQRERKYIKIIKETTH